MLLSGHWHMTDATRLVEWIYKILEKGWVTRSRGGRVRTGKDICIHRNGKRTGRGVCFLYMGTIKMQSHCITLVERGHSILRHFLLSWAKSDAGTGIGAALPSTTPEILHTEKGLCREARMLAEQIFGIQPLSHKRDWNVSSFDGFSPGPSRFVVCFHLAWRMFILVSSSYTGYYNDCWEQGLQG